MINCNRAIVILSVLFLTAILAYSFEHKRNFLDTILPYVTSVIPVENYFLTTTNYVDLVKNYEEKIDKLHKSKVHQFIIGDSHVYTIAKYLRCSVALGVPNDTTVGILSRLYILDELNIKKVYYLIGYNDLRYRSIDSILLNIDSIIHTTAKITSLRMNDIIILSLLPVTGERAYTNSNIKKLNSMLKEHSKTIGFTYIDIHSKFYNNGLQADLSKDGVHLNREGNTILVSLFERCD